jgi:hypothetical protein
MCVAAGVAQQQTTSASSRAKSGGGGVPPAQSGSLSPASLKTDGLNYGDDIKRIYVGAFEQVPIKRDGAEFTSLISGYMTEYAKACSRYLPKDKVEITKQECAREQYTVNGYGQRVGMSTCVEYRTVGTGLYADPRVYSLQKALDSMEAANMLGGFLKGITENSGDPGGMKRDTDIAIYVIQDFSHFFVDNACTSPAVIRFQENMLRFGHGEAAIRMPGAEQAVVGSALAARQNYNGLVNDLIADESRAWLMNRYQAGSAQVSAVRHDSEGNPKEIDADYSYAGLRGKDDGECPGDLGEGCAAVPVFFGRADDMPGAEPGGALGIQAKQVRR